MAVTKDYASLPRSSGPQRQPAPDRGPGLAVLIGAMAVTAFGLAGAVIAAALDDDKRGIGGVLRFREDGGGVELYGEVLLVFAIVVLTLLVGTLLSAGREYRLAIPAAVGAKLLILLAVVFMFAFPDLSQFEGKSLTYRAVLYPTLAFLIPAGYVLGGRRDRYPMLADICLTFALSFDIVSNDLHWYGTWLHWDDIVHFWNSFPIMVLIVGGVMALEHSGRIRLGFWGAFIFAFCIYALMHSLWEMEEFALDRFAGTNLQPGGMEEASRNNVSSLTAALLSTGLFLWWRRLGALEPELAAPLAGLVRAVRKRIKGQREDE